MSKSYTYKQLMEARHKAGDDLSLIMPHMGELAKQLQLYTVRSCVAIGCGCGRPEILLIKHCMPNVEEFIAVEPDAASLDELKKQLAEQLPHVRSVLCQETAQNWSGVDKPVDMVIMWNSLYYFNQVERAALFAKVFHNVLHSGGLVFILYAPRCISGEPVPLFQFEHLAAGAKLETCLTDTNVRDDMIAAGFKMCHQRMFNAHFNVENADDAFWSLLLTPYCSWSLESVRLAVKETFGDSKTVLNRELLGIFQKL